MAVARGTSAPKPRTNHTIRPATQTRTPHSARHTHSTPPLNGHPSGARARACTDLKKKKQTQTATKKSEKSNPPLSLSFSLSLFLSLSASSSEAQVRKRKRARASSLRRSGGRRKRIISRRGMHVTIHNMRMCGEMTEILVEAGSRAHD